MTKPNLANHNELTLLDSGIWVKTDEADRSFIDYTDGDSTEDKVYACVEAASDRSVYSDELDQAWVDWALEYHLGSRRSNIYRGLNLEGVETVLEVGCGCGAITRFLGEQGFQIDAIEGTLRRAEIARLRTEDLENVKIVSSNYHDLILPARHYDLIVFTGVLEYSGAYAPEGVSPEAQLKLTIQRARAALSEGGRILIAIENRTGFKYLAGANEDHLSVPNIGLYGYPELKSQSITRGIRTWSKREWCMMLDEFEFGSYGFCYPFPDYKVPDAIISDHFLDNTLYPEQVLGGIHSRDYAARWNPKLSESLFWRTAAQIGVLDKYANSFLIVVGNSAEKVRQTIDFDFVRFASLTRKLPYRLQVSKKCDEGVVRRNAVESGQVAENVVVSQYCIEQEPFVDGQVLEQTWVQALSVTPSYQELAEHIKTYCVWLDDVLSQGAEKFVDALPGNVIVDNEGVWHLIDQEWYSVNGVSREVILFRALFYFVVRARDIIAEMDIQAARKDIDAVSGFVEFPLIQTLDDFVSWGFTQCGIEYGTYRDICLDFEQNLQKQVTRPDYVRQLEGILAELVFRENLGNSVEIRAYWTQIDDVWHQDHSVLTQALCSPDINIKLELPVMISDHRFFRIDLTTDLLTVFRGYMDLQDLEISVTREAGEQERIYHLASTEELFDQARLKGLRLLERDAFMLTSAGSSMVLDLEGVEWGEHIESVQVSLKIDVLSDANSTREGQWSREELRRSARRIRVRQHILESQQKRIDEGDKRLAILEKKINRSSTTTLGRLLGKFGLMRKYKV